jgi:alkanesulfonate monooxygenase SsuD/methylene tetrahydromethanopterin reductase-like flavin-dependent oxidoreductase (luciferase family)
MEFMVALMPGETDRLGWLRQREDEGWFGVSLGDHVAPNGRSFPHLWVTLTELAMASSSLRIASLFANNLYRSPVEFAHAALTLQAVSGGRFEAGLGAGWAAKDSDASGQPFPGPAERARRYQEGATIASAVLHDGRCSFHGEFYDIELDDIALDVASPPPLVVGVGGPWVTDHVAPLADRVEVVPFAHVFRSGEVDMAAWSTGSTDDVRRAVDRARRANPDAPIGLGVFVAVGNGERVARAVQLFGDGSSKGLAGDARLVAETLLGYRELGVSRCTICELVPQSVEQLAPMLHH